MLATFVDSILDWLSDHAGMLAWGAALFVVSLVVTAVLLRIFVLRMPADYFVVSREEMKRRRALRGRGLRALKNALGVLLIVAGLAMLVLPGQGLLTVLIGLLLTEFPGKRALEKRIVRRPKILAVLNHLRAKHGEEPLRVE